MGREVLTGQAPSASGGRRSSPRQLTARPAGLRSPSEQEGFGCGCLLVQSSGRGTEQLTGPLPRRWPGPRAPRPRPPQPRVSVFRRWSRGIHRSGDWQRISCQAPSPSPPLVGGVPRRLGRAHGRVWRLAASHPNPRAEWEERLPTQDCGGVGGARRLLGPWWVGRPAPEQVLSGAVISGSPGPSRGRLRQQAPLPADPCCGQGLLAFPGGRGRGSVPEGGLVRGLCDTPGSHKPAPLGFPRPARYRRSGH